MRRLLTLAVLSAGLVLALGGVALAADVAIEDDGLSPERVTVDVREPIVWTNNTDQDVSLEGEDPAWESGPIEPGATFSIEITQPGTYSYTSTNGAELQGQIVVREAGGDDDVEGAGDDEGAGGDDEAAQEPEETIDPDEEALPRTGVNSMVPAALAVLLVALGSGILLATHPERALRRP